MSITPEEVAKLHLKSMQGDIVPLLHIVGDMADLIAKQDEAIKAAMKALHIIAADKALVSRLADAKFVARTTLAELTGGKDE